MCQGREREVLRLCGRVIRRLGATSFQRGEGGGEEDGDGEGEGKRNLLIYLFITKMSLLQKHFPSLP